MEAKDIEIKKYQRKLVDFSQPASFSFKEKVTYKHSLSGDYDIWRLARYIFSDILNFKISDQPMEKINWWIDFVYKGKYKCSIAHQKFGFRVYVTAHDELLAKQVAEEIEGKIYPLLLSIKPFIQSYAEEALSTGEIIVENMFRNLYMPYDYFRRKTLHKKRVPALKKGPTRRQIMNSYRIGDEKRHFEQATYLFFFSMLEHLCVLFLAYRNVPERNNVAAFAGMKWSEKFKTVFDISQPEFKELYDYFRGLARYRRNTVAHGYTNMPFSFYLEGARHKISCTLNDKDVAIQWSNHQDNFQMMESFLKLLKKHHTTKNIFAYIQADMNVSFKKRGLSENDMLAKMDTDELKEYIEYMTHKYDDALNMDW